MSQPTQAEHHRASHCFVQLTPVSIPEQSIPGSALHPTLRKVARFWSLMIFNTAQLLRVKYVHGFGCNHMERCNALLPKLKDSALSLVLRCFAQWIMRRALMTFLLTHTSQWGRPQESCLPKVLPSSRVFGASPITELAGSQHSLQRLPGLMLFNNSFEQGQLTCSFFGDVDDGGA